MVKVIIQRINSGIEVKPLRSGSIGPKTLKAMKKAFKDYQREVVDVLAREGMLDSGYGKKFAEGFAETYPKMRDTRWGKAIPRKPEYLMMETEIWGFASGSFSDPNMSDSGSVPSDFRARFCLALQEPLNKNRDGSFSKVVEVKNAE